MEPSCRSVLADQTAKNSSQMSQWITKPVRVGLALGDAVLLGGLAANGPTHPACGGGLDRICQTGSGQKGVLHIVGKVAAVAAVKENAHRVERLAAGLRDGGHCQGPSSVGLLAHAVVKAPGFVLAGVDLGGVHLGLLLLEGLFVCDNSINTLFGTEAKHFLLGLQSFTWFYPVRLQCCRRV